MEGLIKQKDAVKRSYERFTYNREQDWGLYGHDTGIHPLNMMIGGWIPSKVTTIAARSGMGKTATTVQMFDAGRRVMKNRRAEFLFFSWEMESSYLVDRHVSWRVKISNRMLNQGAKLIGSQSMDLIKGAYKDAYYLPVTYQQNSTNIDEVREIFLNFCDYVEEKSEAEGIEIIPVGVIDYIGMSKGSGKHSLRTYDIGDFMNGLKKIANETMGTFCVFAQINRVADDKQIPARNDLADSASIENASDNLILLHRPEYLGIPTIPDPENSTLEHDSTNKMLVRALKSRDFGVGDKLINCEIAYNRFYDLEHTWDFPYWDMYSEKDFWLYELGMTNEKFDISKLEK